MSRKRFRYDKDLGCIVEIHDRANYFEEQPKGPAIISDIEPYRAVASDVACGGKRPVIGGRRQHREFLQRNGYVEVGNERPVVPGFTPPSRRQDQADRINDLRRAMGDFGSNVRD
jgi:hypothetical protein